MQRTPSVLQAILSGAWRAERKRPQRSQLVAAAPLLLPAGLHGLGWRQVAPADRALFAPLRDACRQTGLEQVEHEDRLRLVVTELRRAGVEPILVKGWAVARLYPEAGLRPCGDIDLCVHPEQLGVAQTVLAGVAGARWCDLHAGIADLDDRTWAEVWQRSCLAPLRETKIRILGAEDQLRHLCLHLMRHGAFRPLWLCDVAVAVESRPASFSWEYCLSGDGRLSQWMLCALALARGLLDARLDGPGEHAAAPEWVKQCVLSEWAAGTQGDSHGKDATPLLAQLRHPARFFRALRCRWPNPIEAVFKMRVSPWTRLPRAWYQVRYAAKRASRLPGKIGQPGPAKLPFELHRDEDRRQAG